MLSDIFGFSAYMTLFCVYLSISKLKYEWYEYDNIYDGEYRSAKRDISFL